MRRVWLQGLVFSLLVHVGVLTGGWLWTLLSHPEPPDPAPIEARLVAPEPEPEPPAPEPEQQKPKTPKPETPEPEAAESKPEPEPKAPEPEPEKVAKPQPQPEPEPEPEEPAEPATKQPKQPVPKKRIAEPDKPDPAPEPSKKQAAKPEQSEPKEPEPDKPDPILGKGLSDKIASIGKDGSPQGSLRQRRAVARFQEAVRSRVQSNWLVPPGLEGRKDLTATLRIALTPAGELAAPPKVVDSNGPGYFNSSVVRAVEKAAPFPMPDGPTRYFQNLELHFSPDMVQ
jgi:hypothetical protein